MLNNNRIGYLHFWCQKVLPLVYDNSLSYYEVLLKIRKKLNEVIEFTNDIPEYIDQKFIEAFDEDHLKELISEVFRTIEDAITANNEGTNTHFSTDYSKGTLIWHDNKLYKVKHDVDDGDTIVVNGNVELVNFADMFAEFISEIKGNFTTNDDGLRETSSADRPIHDLVWLGGILYEVTKPIAEGNAYIYSGTNQNVKPTNLDDIYDYLLDLISSEIDAREQADIQIGEDLDAEVRAREEADTQIGEDLGAETTAREEADTEINGKIGTLASLSTTDKTDLVSAINEVNATGGGAIAKIGDLANLVTTAKSNVVNAINETFTINEYQDVVGVKEFGAKCDGVTDDSDALISAINACEGKVLVINGDMKVSKPIPITHPIIIRGNSHTIYTASTFSTAGGLINERQVFLINGANSVKIENLTINCINTANINTGILINNSSKVEINGVNIYDTLGVAVWIRADNQYISLAHCYAYHCDKNVRLNGGGAFHIALGGGGTTNHFVYINECVAKSCGNAGFCTYDADHVVITGCSAIDMQGGPNGREWEVGDGFMLGSNTIIANCFATQIMNAAYYVTGDNNMLIGCNATNCAGMAIDLYTGARTAYDNTIIGLTVNNCGQTPHLDMYPTSTLIAGTKQYRMIMSDINICGGGNNSAPVNAIALDEPAECMISNVRMTDIANINDGIQFGGGQNGNIVQNCKIQGNVNIAQYNQWTVLRNIDNQKPYEDITFTNTEWNNHTHHDVMAYIGGTPTAVYVNNYLVGDARCVYVPHNGKLGVTGSNIEAKIIKL